MAVIPFKILSLMIISIMEYLLEYLAPEYLNILQIFKFFSVKNF